jgi:hypothetical protein
VKTSTALRWIHLALGLVLSYYFMFKPADGWSPAFETFVASFVMAAVAWTGIIKWQLPRLRRWWRRRRCDPQDTSIDESAAPAEV